MKFQLFKSRFLLILIGLSLGYLARLVFGPPSSEIEDQNRFERPLPAKNTIDVPQYKFDLPLDRENEQGLVPPIRLPGQMPLWQVTNDTRLEPGIHNVATAFEHDRNAEFEPHGDLICASGCAASRHPTEELSSSHFKDLLAEFANQPIDESSTALEELLYYGPQTKTLIESEGFGQLGTKRAALLWEQLKFTHARVSIRVVDEQGDLRTWLEPTRVPFDRRHVFEMKTNNLQPLVTSGTVKRVGLNYLWVRL